MANAVGAGHLVHLDVIVVPVELTVQRAELKIRDRYARLWDHILAGWNASMEWFFERGEARTEDRDRES